MTNAINPDTLAVVANSGSLWSWLAGSVVGLPLIGAFAARQFTKMTRERGEQVAINATTTVVAGLREEVIRLQKHNTELVACLRDAQEQVTQLHTRIAALLAHYEGV